MASPIEIEFIEYHSQAAWNDFQSELSTDENKDYRRGFKAGYLFSMLMIKSNLGKEDATTEQPTD